MPHQGAIATGHPVTTEAAAEILRDGGNAFDAIIAAHFTACIVEPVLASLGGGGYLLADPVAGPARVYDFFAQTPLRRQASALDFYPVSADFGTICQEFHIGLGAVATPGSVKGMFAIHAELATLPMPRLLEPAIRAAREGVKVSAMQAYALDVVKPIYLSSASTSAVFGSTAAPGTTLREGEILRQPEQADTLAALAAEGEALFYKGEIARAICDLCADGGLLTTADLAGYQVVVRPPLKRRYRDAELLLNAPPSSGGILIAFALALLEKPSSVGTDPGAAARRLAVAMAATNRARASGRGGAAIDTLLDDGLLQQFRREVSEHPLCSRGTTQMSVADASGNLASMTVSNGEGCGALVPGSGIMLNNMLGEEDINPEGFFRWRENTRMTSMMAPSILHLNGARAALGSGGSNRLRSAILQAILNLTDHDMGLAGAVSAPRMHVENDWLHLEPGAWPGGPITVPGEFGNLREWPDQNLYFGGVHAVWRDSAGFQAAGDPRRGGAALVLE